MKILCLAFWSKGLSRLPTKTLRPQPELPTGPSGHSDRHCCGILHVMLIQTHVIILTRRPETSEYFLAGLKDGGASILKSKKMKEKKRDDHIAFKIP